MIKIYKIINFASKFFLSKLFHSYEILIKSIKIIYNFLKLNERRLRNKLKKKNYILVLYFQDILVSLSLVRNMFLILMTSTAQFQTKIIRSIFSCFPLRCQFYPTLAASILLFVVKYMTLTVSQISPGREEDLVFIVYFEIDISFISSCLDTWHFFVSDRTEDFSSEMM